MTIILLALMAVGAIAGRCLPGQGVVPRVTNILLLASIFALLFLLGIDIGSNDTVFDSLATVGLESVAIAAAGIHGCGPFALLLRRSIRP